jgi:hypothetical protein
MATSAVKLETRFNIIELLRENELRASGGTRSKAGKDLLATKTGAAF